MVKRIAHIEDDPDIRLTVKTILSKEGYEVSFYETSEQFLTSLNTSPLPDFIILDVMVEKEDSGLTTYDLLSEKYPEIPIIILTSLGKMILPYFEHRQEKVCILEKPIIPELLLSYINNQMQKGQC